MAVTTPKIFLVRKTQTAKQLRFKKKIRLIRIRVDGCSAAVCVCMAVTTPKIFLARKTQTAKQLRFKKKIRLIRIRVDGCSAAVCVCMAAAKTYISLACRNSVRDAAQIREKNKTYCVCVNGSGFCSVQFRISGGAGTSVLLRDIATLCQSASTPARFCPNHQCPAHHLHFCGIFCCAATSPHAMTCSQC